jgi:hypothetical protein
LPSSPDANPNVRARAKTITLIFSSHSHSNSHSSYKLQIFCLKHHCIHVPIAIGNVGSSPAWLFGSDFCFPIQKTKYGKSRK